MDLVRRAAVEALALALFSAPAFAHEAEVAGAYYTDEQLTEMMLSTRGGYDTRKLWPGEGHMTSVHAGLTVKQIEFKTIGNLLEEQLGGKTSVQEQSVNASADQGLRVGTTAGVLLGATKSPLSDSSYYGAHATQWFLEETLQTTFDYRRTKVSQPPVGYTDTDGQRVATPSDLDGDNFGVTVTNLTTPTTILRGALSYTTRSDRPPAWSASAEGRQFITAAGGAVHASLTHYENVGPIQPNTTYGTVVANSIRAEWHQRMANRFVAMGGYRYYLEVENPRASDAENNQVGADSIYGSLRWRYGKELWTADGPEAFVFLARYTTNVPNEAYLIGVGGRFLF